jgi:glycosyltransferase involved in cell wall biosynthesis
LLKQLDYEKYEVTLMLEKKTGLPLNEIPSKVIIKEYKLSNFPIKVIRGIWNSSKLILTGLLNRDKYDFACCYTTYSIPGSLLVKKLSQNNCLWVHSDYYHLYDQNPNKIKSFFDTREISLFKRIVFVANEARDNFLQFYPELENKTLVCNNPIDADLIEKKAKEKIKEKKPKCPLFINVSRHVEHSKRLTRLIQASKELVDRGYQFEVWLIGSGLDTPVYKKMIDELDLGKTIKLLGFKSNPYPYYKKADAYVLTSEYEGFPVVFIESLIFNVPIISTIDVTDDLINIKDKYGIIVDKDAEGVYKGMKDFIKDGYKIKERFDVKRYNERIMGKIQKMLDNEEML